MSVEVPFLNKTVIEAEADFLLAEFGKVQTDRIHRVFTVHIIWGELALAMRIRLEDLGFLVRKKEASLFD